MRRSSSSSRRSRALLRTANGSLLRRRVRRTRRRELLPEPLKLLSEPSRAARCAPTFSCHTRTHTRTLTRSRSRAGSGADARALAHAPAPLLRLGAKVGRAVLALDAARRLVCVRARGARCALLDALVVGGGGGGRLEDGREATLEGRERVGGEPGVRGC